MVWLSKAAYWAWGVAAVATVAAGWHIWGITDTPERPFFWVITVLDLLVAVTALGVGLQWPRYAVFDAEGIVLHRKRIRYEAITELRLGDVSAKPFWLAAWLPTSLLGGLIVALIPADTFDRQVVEIGTENRRARLRWRGNVPHDDFVAAVRESRPDLEITYGVDRRTVAVDFTPRLSIGGGLLVAGLAAWVLFAGVLSVQLFDRSTVDGPYPSAATSNVLRSVTADLKGYAPLPGVPAEYKEWRCDRNNYAFLGPSPDVIDLHMKLVAEDMPRAMADAYEAKLRSDTGMASFDYLHRIDDPVTDVEIDIPEVKGLYVEISTGCVSRADLGPLRDDLTKMAAALGAAG
ncbi:hypothetical protein EV192_108131 [Actinocrispum wychmicini]|uniref:Uncharacterized protein n=1 Tax=Actinocrispum wychmicini TaxID=1213861 RepID=A0A4R2J703_9PSEU|nr:hypothetical protein EV192_108131 [Actinocrispum wychmicini]